MKLRYTFLALALITFILTGNANAQFRDGAFGFNAAMAMPSGITASAALPSNAVGQVGFAYGASTSFDLLLGSSTQLELGVGFANVSFSVPEGQTAPDAQTTISFAAGMKYFLSHGDVMPYLGLGASYTALPTVKQGTTEISGSMITALGSFGAQAFINQSKSVALFIQIGLGFNVGTITTKVGNFSGDNGISTLNLGGSAFGGSIYF